MQIENFAWRALMSMFDTAKDDSKMAKVLFEMWLQKNYYQKAYRKRAVKAPCFSCGNEMAQFL